MYQLLRQALFLLDAEKAHYLSMNALRGICTIPLFRSIISNIFTPADPELKRTCFGLSFKNPVGLGAGFDKNACYLRELEALGFGFVEIGTVTPLPQEGNEKPRLFRLPEDKALINRMGFNNDGVEKIKTRLEKWKSEHAHLPEGERMIIGGNIGKNKATPNEEAWRDYEKCFNALFDVVDYFVVNVSSPNTPGLRALQDKDALLQILGKLQENNNARPKRKPLLLKIAPDLSEEQLNDIAHIAEKVQLDGIVSSNTTIAREPLGTASKQAAASIGAGGLSGKPVKASSDAVLEKIITLTQRKVPVIASGSIFTGSDAQDKFDKGAVMVQVWTGFIYEGPSIVKKICKQLINLQ